MIIKRCYINNFYHIFELNHELGLFIMFLRNPSSFKIQVDRQNDEKNSYRRVAGSNNPFHPKTAIVGGVLEEECSELMKDFFKNKR